MYQILFMDIQLESNVATQKVGVRVVCALSKQNLLTTVDINMIAQFDSLPIELIKAIFVLCLSRDFLKVLQPNKSKAPIVLCHVCRKWREITFDTPLLWSRLHVRITVLTFLKKVKGVVLDQERFIAPKSQDFLNWWASNLKVESQPFTLSVDQPRQRRGFHHSDHYKLETTFNSHDIETNTYAAFLSCPLVTSARNLNLSLMEDDFRMLCATSAEFKTHGIPDVANFFGYSYSLP